MADGRAAPRLAMTVRKREGEEDDEVEQGANDETV